MITKSFLHFLKKNSIWETIGQNWLWHYIDITKGFPTRTAYLMWTITFFNRKKCTTVGVDKVHYFKHKIFFKRSTMFVYLRHKLAANHKLGRRVVLKYILLLTLNYTNNELMTILFSNARKTLKYQSINIGVSSWKCCTEIWFRWSEMNLYLIIWPIWYDI